MKVRTFTLDGAGLSAVEWAPPVVYRSLQGEEALGQRVYFRATSAWVSAESWLASEMDVDEAVARHLALNLGLEYSIDAIDAPSLGTAIGRDNIPEGPKIGTPPGMLVVRVIGGGRPAFMSLGRDVPDYRPNLEVAMRLDRLPRTIMPNRIFDAWSILAHSDDVDIPVAVTFARSGNKWQGVI